MASLLPQIPLDTPLSVGQHVRVTFPNSSISKDGVVKRVIHPKKPSNPKDGNYEIIKIDNDHKNFWLTNIDRTVITTAKRGYIKDFASEAVVAA